MGHDRAGSPDVLTPDRFAPSGAITYSTCVVQVEKYEEEHNLQESEALVRGDMGIWDNENTEPVRNRD